MSGGYGVSQLEEENGTNSQLLGRTSVVLLLYWHVHTRAEMYILLLSATGPRTISIALINDLH